VTVSAILLVLSAQVAGQADAPPAVVRVAEKLAGTLPIRLEAGRNRASVVFVLDPGATKSCTVRLESLDFDPRLLVEDESKPGKPKEGARLGFWDGLAGIGDATGRQLRFVVESEDDRGGEFTLSVLEGLVEAPGDPAERARNYIDGAAAIAARAEAREDWTRAAQLRERASHAAFQVRDPARARVEAEHQLNDAERGGDTELALRARIGIGGALRQLGESRLAEEALAKAAGQVEKLLAESAEPRSEARLAVSACRVFDNLGDLALASRGPREAAVLYRKFVEFAPRSQDRGLESTAWRKLGFALDESGERAEAAAAIDEALAIAEELPNDTEGLAAALLSRGRHLSKHGPSAEARAVCERALALLPSPPRRIELLGVLSGACIDLGRFEQAQSAMDELESLCARHGITDYEVPIRLNRATIAFRLGDVEISRRLLEEALALSEGSAVPGDRIDILLDLGWILEIDGEAELARQRFDEALEATENTGDRSREARARIDLARFLEKRGDLASAVSELDRAAGIAEDIGEARTASVARAGRGYVLFRQGKLGEGREMALREALILSELGERRAAVDAQDTLARIGLAMGDLDLVEKTLAAADEHLAEIDEPCLDRFSSAGLRSDYADWGCLAQDLVRRRLESATTDAERADIAARGWSRAGVWKGRVLLERMHVAGRDSSAGGPPLAPRGSAIVDYVEGIDRLYAYVSHEGGLRFVDLGERAPIEDAARRLVDGIAKRSIDPTGFAQQAGWLYERLVTPLAAALAPGIERLTVVPTPALSTLPFEVLVQPASVDAGKARGFAGLRCLIDEYEIVAYAPAAPVLARLDRRQPRAGARRFLIAGDPTYRREILGDAADATIAAARPGGELLDYDRIKGTREEVREVASLLIVQDEHATDEQRAKLLALAGERSATVTSGTFDLYVGTSVEHSIFESDLTRYSHLHLATHGHVDPSDPRRSGLVLGYEPSSEGLLALEDVLGFRLDADLVVLSACDTARGRIVRGEGVESLANAFLEAGARAVVASLWKIEDGETAEMMSNFYEAYLHRKLPPGEALRFAKLEFRRSTAARSGIQPAEPSAAWATSPANPYFWAPFVFVGSALR